MDEPAAEDDGADYSDIEPEEDEEDDESDPDASDIWSSAADSGTP